MTETAAYIYVFSVVYKHCRFFIYFHKQCQVISVTKHSKSAAHFLNVTQLTSMRSKSTRVKFQRRATVAGSALTDEFVLCWYVYLLFVLLVRVINIHVSASSE